MRRARERPRRRVDLRKGRPRGLDGQDLVDTPAMARFRAEARAEEGPHALHGELDADDPRAEAQDVHVVVLDALARGVRVVADAGADAADLRRGDRGAHAAAADEDAPVGPPVGDRPPEAQAEIRVVVLGSLPSPPRSDEPRSSGARRAMPREQLALRALPRHGRTRRRRASPISVPIVPATARRRASRATAGADAPADGPAPASGSGPRTSPRRTRGRRRRRAPTVKPNFSKIAAAGAEAPKWSSADDRPAVARPSAPSRGVAPASIGDARPDVGGSTASRYAAVLRLEQLPARHAHDRASDGPRAPAPRRRPSPAAAPSPVASRMSASLPSGPRPSSPVRAAAGLPEHVAAAADAVARELRGARERRQLLAGQRECDRAAAPFHGDAPGGRRLVGVARPDEPQVRHRPQRRVVLDRLMRRAVLAEAHRVVRPDVDDVQAATSPPAARSRACSR